MDELQIAVLIVALIIGGIIFMIIAYDGLRKAEKARTEMRVARRNHMEERIRYGLVNAAAASPVDNEPVNQLVGVVNPLDYVDALSVPNTSHVWTGTIATEQIANNSIGLGHIADDSVHITNASPSRSSSPSHSPSPSLSSSLSESPSVSPSSSPHYESRIQEGRQAIDVRDPNAFDGLGLAQSSSTSTMLVAGATTVDLSELRDRIRTQVLNELKEEGKIIGKSSLKPMTKERRKRRLDAIIEKGAEENEK